MNDGRKQTSWILLGALGLALATALAVFTLERAPSAPEPAQIARTAPRPAGPEDRAEQPPDSRHASDSSPAAGKARAAGTGKQGPAPTPIDADPRAIQGEVQSLSGEPIAGADIRLQLVEPEQAEEIGRARSTQQGRFEVSAHSLEELDPPRRGLAQLVATARAAGFQAETQSISLRLHGSEGGTRLFFTFRLKPGNTLAGRIVDQAGAPVRGAEVQLIVPAAEHGTVASAAARNVCAHDRTQSDGRFVLSFVSSGTYQLAAREPNTGTAFQAKLELAADENRELADVVLRGDGILAGRAQDPGGKPARSVELWAIPDWMAGDPNALATAALKAGELERDDGLLYGRTTTDAAGHFRFAGLKNANYAIRSPRPEMVLEPRQARYVLGTENVTIEVQTYRLIVHVKDATGRPLPGAAVACAETTLVQDGRLETVKVDHGRASGPEGTVAFEVDSDRTYALTATAPGCLPAEDLAILAPGEYEGQRDLVLQPAAAKGRLHLMLEGAGNESVARLEVAFDSALTEQRSEGIGVVSPDADGWISALPPGRYRLQIGFGARDGQLSMYFPIQTREEVDIRPNASTEHVVRARPGARVRLMLEVDGAPSKPPGAGSGGGEPRGRHLGEQGAAVTVAAGAAGAVRHVQFVKPAPDNPRSIELASFLVPGQSALIADLLEPGECTLHVEAPGYAAAEAHVTLRPAAIEEVRIRLQPK